MFDLSAKDGSVRRKPYRSPIPDTPAPEAVPPGKLDAEPMGEMHTRLLALYTHELDRQWENRQQMAKDEEFYDNNQWRPEDAQQLEERGQVPLVYNVIATTVDWVIGTEKRARTDFKVLPRRKEGGKPAERKSQLLKYLSDVNRDPFSVSRAFEDAVKAGLGWLEDGIQDNDEEEQLYSRYEDWRNILWDSASTEFDLSDGRYVFRTKWVDLDVACALFPERKAVLERAAADSDDFIALDQYGDEFMDSREMEQDRAGNSTTSDRVLGYRRQRVRLIEAWYRKPDEVTKMRGGTFAGEIFDHWSPAHREELASGTAETIDRTTMRVHVAILTTAGMLWFSPSPFRHNRFPFTPIWAHRRRRDGLPYGMIRRLRDIQDDINKRASKALHILSTNKIVMDEDAIPDDMSFEEFQEEASRPDAIIRKKSGRDLVLNAERDLSQWHLELMSRSIAMIQQASGVTDELLGRRTNASSGIAIQRRQDQGAMATAGYFDNLAFATQIRGEKQLANIEQFMTEEKQFRITNMRGAPEYVTINDGLPDNDVIRTKADYVLSEAAWQASLRQAAASELTEILVKLAPSAPQLVMVMLDLVVESMDVPNRDEIVKRIRAVTGMSDPDQEEPTEEEVQRAQQQAADAALQRAGVEAEIRKKVADAMRAEAQARQHMARTVGDNVDAQQKALAAAQAAIAVPASADVADHILHEAGFVSRTDQEAAMAAAAAQQQQAAQEPAGLQAAR